MKKRIVLLSIFLLCIVSLQAQPAKNAIWMIADGTGTSAMGLFMEAVRNTDLPQYPQKKSILENFISAGVMGLYFDNTYDSIVTDSACAATQMSTGQFSRPDYIGIDYDARPQETLLEQAFSQGKVVGVVTDVYVADATPAGFLTHTKSRKNKYDIARQLVHSDAQVILGGGLKYFNTGENKNLLKEAKELGWQVVTNRKELAKVKKGRVLGLFAKENMPFYGDREQYPQTPTLLEMTQKAVELLSQNEKGFVLMTEAGKVDWALHDNEAGPALWEMVNLDETLSYLWQYATQTGDTLLYLNADHETGMPAFEYRHLDPDALAHKSAQGEMLYGSRKDTDYVAYAYYQNLWKHTHLLYYVYADFKKLPPDEQTAEKLQNMCNEAMGMKTDLHFDGRVPSYNGLIAALNKAQGMTWATKTHSSGMLIGVAYGPGAEDFAGVYRNTQLKEKFEKALGFKTE